ncbi:MAG TPA: M20/M25/M40 family metallo-hydrolase [Anaerolineales bacterium]|nr:M20/M25/M40 family metallo-hydrolase [Anaerolineales bacterium]
MTNRSEQLLDLAIQIQQIAAPTFAEQARAEFVRGLFIRQGLLDVTMDTVSNVYGRLPGRGTARPLIVSAHLDTVFPANTRLAVSRETDRIFGPGIGDNSLGVAALFGLIWTLRDRGCTPAGDIWLVGNVGEEGLGNLRGMNAVADRFGEAVLAYLVLEGTALGHVYHRAIAVQRYRVWVRTAGGHSWSDFGRPSAIHELARIVTQMTTLPMPASPRTSLNVGMISGGTGVNVLAPEASLELDVRSESPEVLSTLVDRVQEIVQAARREGVSSEIEMIGQRPSGEIDRNHPLVKLAERCLLEQGLEASFTSGSTDANVPLSRGYPALVLGITTGGSAHTVQEYIDVRPVEQGMQQLASFVENVFSIH